jgi:hypothetical protein
MKRINEVDAFVVRRASEVIGAIGRSRVWSEPACADDSPRAGE